MAVVASIAVGVGAAGLQYSAGRKAAKNQRRANEATRQINRLRNRQAKRQFLKQFRQAQAATLVEGVAAGIGLGSSRVRGTTDSQSSQAFKAVEEFNEMDRLGGEAVRFNNAALARNVQASGFGALSRVAQNFIGFSFGP